jgi:hypothetical protein
MDRRPFTLTANKPIKDDLETAIPAGLAAGTAYLGTMWLDNKISSWDFDDLKLVGQMFTTKSPLWQLQGLAGHYAFSIAMSTIYIRYARRHLPGPGWLRGITFMMLENALLYPAAGLIDNIHAGMKANLLPPLLNKKTFLGQVTRHIAFGAVLGLLASRD